MINVSISLNFLWDIEDIQMFLLHMGMFKNNEAFHFMASHADVCLDFKDQTELNNVLWSLCSSCKFLSKSNT